MESPPFQNEVLIALSLSCRATAAERILYFPILPRGRNAYTVYEASARGSTSRARADERGSSLLPAYSQLLIKFSMRLQSFPPAHLIRVNTFAEERAAWKEKKKRGKGSLVGSVNTLGPAGRSVPLCMHRAGFSGQVARGKICRCGKERRYSFFFIFFRGMGVCIDEMMRGCQRGACHLFPYFSLRQDFLSICVIFFLSNRKIWIRFDCRAGEHTDYKHESRTGPLPCFASTNS